MLVSIWELKGRMVCEVCFHLFGGKCDSLWENAKKTITDHVEILSCNSLEGEEVLDLLSAGTNSSSAIAVSFAEKRGVRGQLSGLSQH